MSALTAYGTRMTQRWRGTPPFVVDAVLVVACFATTLVYATLNHGFVWWIVALVAANTAPLLWRRRYPFAVTAICGVGTAWLALIDALGNYAPAQLVATYTFAALCPPVKRLIAAVCTAIGITLSITIPSDDLLNLGPNAIVFLAAYALGTSARARRDRITMLEERARRLAEEQAAAATRERQRIAREMHDILAHSMSLVVVQAEAGPVAVRTDPDKAEATFETISATARDALAQLRRTLGVLRSGDVPDRQPVPGLDTLPALVDAARHAGLIASLDVAGDPRPISADLAATVHRIVQESLTNTVKHARARTARVQLTWSGDALRVEIADDGRGPEDIGESNGHGLIGMRERVTTAGGRLTCGADTEGRGYRVVAELPLG